MPTDGKGPTDRLLVLFEVVRGVLADMGGPSWVPDSVTINVRGRSCPITLPVPEPAPAGPATAPGTTSPARRPFKPNEFQESILDALGGKFLTTDALAAKVGERRRLFKPGGIKDLVEAGLVGNRPGSGYYSTEDPPREVEEEQGA